MANYEEKNYLSKMGTCIMTSVIGYLFMGVTNDSMICISPIFYVLLGIGMAINKIIKSEKVS